VDVEAFQIDGAFPAMAQAILASDDTISKRPDLIRRFVNAILKGVQDIIADPDAAALTYLREIGRPETEQPYNAKILRLYVERVYPVSDGLKLGQFDPARIERVQRFYLANDIVREATPAADLFTNAFVAG
jgi:NitT/TauT family transport system substrate-binding protein